MLKEELLRYSRHIMLPEIDIEGQEKINDMSLAFIGMGGLGCSASLYSALSGFGKIKIIDFDFVEASNLQRQILFDENDLSKNKATTSVKKLSQLNPFVELKGLEEKVDSANIKHLLKDSEIILDCSDNFETRKIVNKYCVKHNKILISGSSIAWKGQLGCFDLRDATNSCYECLFEDLENEDLSCRESAIASPLVGAIGSLMAIEVIKATIEKNFESYFMIFDSLKGIFKRVDIHKNPQCRICRI